MSLLGCIEAPPNIGLDFSHLKSSSFRWRVLLQLLLLLLFNVCCQLSLLQVSYCIPERGFSSRYSRSFLPPISETRMQSIFWKCGRDPVQFFALPSAQKERRFLAFKSTSFKQISEEAVTLQVAQSHIFPAFTGLGRHMEELSPRQHLGKGSASGSLRDKTPRSRR